MSSTICHSVSESRNGTTRAGPESCGTPPSRHDRPQGENQCLFLPLSPIVRTGEEETKNETGERTGSAEIGRNTVLPPHRARGPGVERSTRPGPPRVREWQLAAPGPPDRPTPETLGRRGRRSASAIIDRGWLVRRALLLADMLGLLLAFGGVQFVFVVLKGDSTNTGAHGVRSVRRDDSVLGRRGEDLRPVRPRRGAGRRHHRRRPGRGAALLTSAPGSSLPSRRSPGLQDRIPRSSSSSGPSGSCSSPSRGPAPEPSAAVSAPTFRTR